MIAPRVEQRQKGFDRGWRLAQHSGIARRSPSQPPGGMAWPRNGPI